MVNSRRRDLKIEHMHNHGHEIEELIETHHAYAIQSGSNEIGTTLPATSGGTGT